MFDFIKNETARVSKKSLYCVWIRAHEGDNAPLIRVWIDPSMTMFETGAKVHESDVAAARAESPVALAEDSSS
jgi:hypothetical protein